MDYEKIFPNTNLSKTDNLQTEKILEEIQSFFIEYFNKETTEKEKIILKGKKEGD